MEDISDYTWIFCINYIFLNEIIPVGSYKIPRFENIVMDGFGQVIIQFFMNFQVIMKLDYLQTQFPKHLSLI